MTLLLTPKEIAEVDHSTSDVEFPKALAKSQLRKDLEELKRIYGFDSFVALIKLMEAEVEE